MSELILQSTSSGPNGWSALEGFLFCPIKAHQARQRRLENPGQGYMPYEEKDGKPVATTVGSIYGELAQRWLRDDPVRPSTKLFWSDGVDVQDLQKTHPATVAQAWTMYDGYTAKYAGAKPWDEIIGCEIPITIPGSLFGFDFDISGNLDLLVKKEGRLGVVDLKSDGRNDANLKMKYSLRGQKWVYALGAELGGHGKPDFCAVDLCIKNKEPKYDIFEYEGLTDQRFKWLSNLMQRVKYGMENPVAAPLLSNCWAYGEPCGFYLNNTCSLL